MLPQTCVCKRLKLSLSLRADGVVKPHAMKLESAPVRNFIEFFVLIRCVRAANLWSEHRHFAVLF
jgi:hypothetical protein